MHALKSSSNFIKISRNSSIKLTPVIDKNVAVRLCLKNYRLKIRNETACKSKSKPLETLLSSMLSRSRISQLIHWSKSVTAAVVFNLLFNLLLSLLACFFFAKKWWMVICNLSAEEEIRRGNEKLSEENLKCEKAGNGWKWKVISRFVQRFDLLIRTNIKIRYQILGAVHNLRDQYFWKLINVFQ